MVRCMEGIERDHTIAKSTVTHEGWYPFHTHTHTHTHTPLLQSLHTLLLHCRCLQANSLFFGLNPNSSFLTNSSLSHTASSPLEIGVFLD